MSIAPETLAELADEFAFQLCFSPHDAMSAGLRAFKGDTGWSGWAAQWWFMHPYIRERCASFIEEYGAAYFLPTKEQVAQRVFHTAEKATTADDKLKGYRLYADMIGAIPKADKSTNVSVNTGGGSSVARKVMEVREFGNDWEKAAAAQQGALERKQA
jgi:hypothetical protein